MSKAAENANSVNRLDALTAATVTDAKALNAPLGSKVITSGYYEEGDGGGNTYIVALNGSGVADGGSFIDMDNGLQLKALFKYGASPTAYGLNEGDTTDYPVSSRVAESRVFIDNLRQFNFHTSGAPLGEHTFLLDDSKFRIAEAPRSLNKPIGECKKVLFIGDSLTAYSTNLGSYTTTTSRKLQERVGGVKDAGYFAAEMSANSAKQQFFEVDVAQSGMSYLYGNGIPYTDERRNYSPDGKGVTVTGATGSQFYRWNFSKGDNVKYTKYRLYYLRRPGGGTFSVANGGGSPNSINTDGALGMVYSQFTYSPSNPETESNKDISITNITGDVVLYGVELVDEEVEDGFSFDVFARSGGALFELVSLSQGSLNTYMNQARPDTVVINMGTNDSTQGRTVAEFESDLNAYIDRIQNTVSYDVKFVIVSPNNMQWTNHTGSTRADYEDARRKFCRENEHMYIDLPSEVGNFNFLETLGLMNDGTHPNVKGSELIGLRIAEKLIGNASPLIKKYPQPQSLNDTSVVAYGSFHYDNGALVVESSEGCSISRAATGVYDVTFDKPLADKFFGVILPSNTGNRSIYIANQTVNGFRIGYESYSNVFIDTSFPLVFTVMGRTVSRK